MLGWAAVFLAIALVAAAFGFTGAAVAATAAVAKLIFFVFIGLFALAMVTRALRDDTRDAPRRHR